MLTITSEGTAFKAMSTVIMQRTKEELQAEEANSKIVSNKATDTQMQLHSQNQIIFTDPTNSKEVKITLTQENIDKLKNNFKSDDFYQKQDGSIRLSGKAEAFVSGWYGDIAYNRNFLKADTDKDGKLSDEEYKNTKNGFYGVGTDTFLVNLQTKDIQLESSNEEITQSYISPSDEKKRKAL